MGEPEKNISDLGVLLAYLWLNGFTNPLDDSSTTGDSWLTPTTGTDRVREKVVFKSARNPS